MVAYNPPSTGGDTTALEADLSSANDDIAALESRLIARAHIADPAGGTIVDAESRTAINAILNILEAAGLMAP
jgi:hypothetical protein